MLAELATLAKLNEEQMAIAIVTAIEYDFAEIHGLADNDGVRTIMMIDETVMTTNVREDVDAAMKKTYAVVTSIIDHATGRCVRERAGWPGASRRGAVFTALTTAVPGQYASGSSRQYVLWLLLLLLLFVYADVLAFSVTLMSHSATSVSIGRFSSCSARRTASFPIMLRMLCSVCQAVMPER